MKRVGLFFIISVLTTNLLYSRHIVGSEFYYDCNGNGQVTNTKKYSFQLKLYRDCSTPILFNPNAAFGIYRHGMDGNYTFINQFIIPHGPTSIVVPEQITCITVPPNICVESTTFQFSTELPVIDETYIIFYIQCCRTNTLSNIINPGSTGNTFFIEITPIAQQECNSSPRFKNLPPIMLCANTQTDFDFSATDTDGDSLIYEFCPLLSGGGASGGGCTSPTPDPRICPPPFKQVEFQPGSNYNSPVDQGSLNLNSRTGKLTSMINNIGQYVFGICVKEYRNGKLVGTILRDLQFNVLDCSVLSSTIDLRVDNIFTTSSLPVKMDPLANDSIHSKSNITVNISDPQMGKLSYSSSTGKGIFTPNSKANIKEVLTYTVCLIVCPSSCKSSTIEIEIDVACGDRNSLVLPNVLFPAGPSGANRYFFVEAIEKCPGAFGPKPHILQVFNRWGGLVYRNDNYLNDWDGTTTSGHPLPSGSYYYLLDLGSVAAPVRGYVVIMR